MQECGMRKGDTWKFEMLAVKVEWRNVDWGKAF